MNWSIHDWPTLIGVVSFFGAISLAMVRSIFKLSKKITYFIDGKDSNQNTAIELLKNASLATLHSQLYEKGDKYIKQGWITLSQIDDLEYTWQSYEALGGNGTGELIYNKCRALPISEYSPNSNWQDVENLAREHEVKRNA